MAVMEEFELLTSNETEGHAGKKKQALERSLSRCSSRNVKQAMGGAEMDQAMIMKQPFQELNLEEDDEHAKGMTKKKQVLMERSLSGVGSSSMKQFSGDIEALKVSPDHLLDDDGRTKRTGSVWTASAHIVTAVIGSGVLSLAWSMAQLGWVAGPAVLIAFAMVTGYTSLLLADCYRSPNGNQRNYTYMDAVRTHLGGFQIWLCGITQYSILVGTTVGYTITSSISMVAIKRSNCFHKEGHDAPCHVSNNPYMIIFGITQILLSQLSDFQRLWWLSIVATIMSFSYSCIGIALSVVKAFEGGHSHGTIHGGTSNSERLWFLFQALGDIAFAYSFSIILIEIQDTIKSPPAENKTMKRASIIGVSTTTIFYMISGCMGYAAFGSNAPGNLLTGFGFYNPYWLVDLANVCIVIHLVGAYQIFCQPIFAFVEHWIANNYPKNNFFQDKECRILACGAVNVNLFRLIWRSGFVIVITIVSMIMPFFNDILGILGAMGFWPLTVYFPIQMHISKKKVKRWSTKWMFLQLLSMCCLCVSLVAFISSMEGVISDLQGYRPFAT